MTGPEYIDDFVDACRKRFQSYDGFVSFYDPDYTTWGDLSEWDENQLGTLLFPFYPPSADELLAEEIEEGVVEDILEGNKRESNRKDV